MTSSSPRTRRTRTGARAPFALLVGLLSGLLLALLGGCTLVNGPASGGASPGGGGPPEEAPVARAYAGQISVQGSSLPVVLSLRVRGREVEDARLSIPELEMEAHGEGSLEQGRMELELEYGDGCRGRARITGELGDAGHAFQGILTADDCTGEEEGALILRLREGPPARPGDGGRR